MNTRILTFVAIVLTGASSLAGCATSAGGREVAETLSAQVTVVAEEGARFAAARDSLAKERLLNMQILENSAFVTEYENALDQKAWEVVGAEFRLKLFREVLAVTEDIGARRDAENARRQRQAAELAARRSAVRVQVGELAATAQALSALASEADLDEQRSQLQDYVGSILSDIASSSTVGTEVAEKGKSLTEAAAKSLAEKTAEDENLSAARVSSP